MLSTEISSELKAQIESNQTQLKNAIRNHQMLITKLKDSNDVGLSKQIQLNIEEAQQQIIIIGLDQKSLVEKLRKEYKLYQQNLKVNANLNGIEDRRFNLSNALSRARKQNIITRTPTVPSASPSEESELPSSPPTPEPVAKNPLNPQDISQSEFLTYFGLATHEVFKQIQNKRAERKRRRTANPQFLYTRGWDISKRKRNMYLANISPPHTRQSAKKTRALSPTVVNKRSRPNSPQEKKLVTSGLIDKVMLARSNADCKTCVVCRLDGNLNVCELCTNGFHIACYNRPLNQQPKNCPKCYKDFQNPESPNYSPTLPELLENLKQKEELTVKNKELTSELTQLQDRHSQLTISLKAQEMEREKIAGVGLSTEQKIKQLLNFINTIKETDPEPPSISSVSS